MTGPRIVQEEQFFPPFSGEPSDRALNLLVNVNPVTFGIRAFRIVDPDINALEILQTIIVQPALAAEDPFLPTANIAFAGDITGTVGGVAASTVATVATNFNTRNDRDGSAILTPIITC